MTRSLKGKYSSYQKPTKSGTSKDKKEEAKLKKTINI